MFSTLVSLLERLNLSTPHGFVGLYFMEIMAFLSIIFGGSLLLLSCKHRSYYLGVLGLLAGGCGGLALKSIYAPEGWVAPCFYMLLGACLGCFIAVHFQRFVGILLGGFAIACMAYVFFPAFFRPGEETYLALAVAFLFGGGLGAIFPRFFFIFNSSLIGSAFATFGLSILVIQPIFRPSAELKSILIHTLVFLPLFITGMVYQLTRPEEDAEEPQQKSEKKPEPTAA